MGNNSVVSRGYGGGEAQWSFGGDETALYPDDMHLYMC